jgi:RNA polymerase sigma-70 factor, ECF subfamily
MEPTETADLIQDVFILLHQKLPEFSYDMKRRFRGWLWTVFRNKYRERLRQPPPHTTGMYVPIEGEDPISDLITRDEQAWLIRRALEVMKADFEEKTWRACWEFIIGGRPAEDIAAELGMTRNAVFLAKYRVLRRLREEFAGLLDDH